jgi:hypothetical protein
MELNLKQNILSHVSFVHFSFAKKSGEILSFGSCVKKRTEK